PGDGAGRKDPRSARSLVDRGVREVWLAVRVREWRLGQDCLAHGVRRREVRPETIHLVSYNARHYIPILESRPRVDPVGAVGHDVVGVGPDEGNGGLDPTETVAVPVPRSAPPRTG